ncbi:Uncharacterised protein [Acinetobacter baumannii]|nr:Uncharacterised protein [Acinetobacter baumannii]
MDKIKSIDWAAWVGTLLLIIGFREGSVVVMRAFGHHERKWFCFFTHLCRLLNYAGAYG